MDIVRKNVIENQLNKTFQHVAVSECLRIENNEIQQINLGNLHFKEKFIGYRLCVCETFKFLNLEFIGEVVGRIYCLVLRVKFGESCKFKFISTILRFIFKL